jgi:hypothetical protein
VPESATGASQGPSTRASARGSEAGNDRDPSTEFGGMAAHDADLARRSDDACARRTHACNLTRQRSMEGICSFNLVQLSPWS